MLVGDKLISLDIINQDVNQKLDLYKHFIKLYRYYLNGRPLTDGKESVLNTAIKILIWKVYCKTFKDICWYRYAFAARVPERRKLEQYYMNAKSENQKNRYEGEIKQLRARFIRGYDDLLNINLPNYGLYKKGTKAISVDHDRIMFDIYDYIDKLISFKLSDVFYAVIFQYYTNTKDERSLKLAKYFKYGTDNEKEILMMRYGLTFEEIEWVSKYVINISSEEIVFDPSIKELSPDKLISVERYII